MDNLLVQLKSLQEKNKTLANLLNLELKEKEAKKLQAEQANPDFWRDQERAVKVGQALEKIQKQLQPFTDLEIDLKELKELVSLAETEAPELRGELELKIIDLEKRYQDLEFYSLMSGVYDDSDVYLSIHAGTGGVDAQDFALMLERMYLRFCERVNFKIELVERSLANEAGIKSALYKISAPYAYGYFKSEHGVHRLVRISPFDGEDLRQTSFALVEVTPELPTESLPALKDEDLKIDLFRASGPGGQNVNKTESAVRITHLPTGLVVACQTERSQHQNKATALSVLQAKLHQRALLERAGEIQEIKGGVVTASWGRQIRSYVLQPYQMVKDHRTNYSTSDVNNVLDGDLKSFMEAYLRFSAKEGAEN
ncbi:peptide chain release factor 2 [Candidatus Falkowbacteria bacterium]|nr:peptide chain release factor 2 [Patescibacteria group bacterium]MDD3434927.1 peptide chain release factor 2 [Patescibacteria group bacterium]MDD4466666.1 peptide chain release factor 2 [Patescibacteria group bacterium]NCU43193.1 peptide chain release factor 2 [Candidatus Falkowbacteria bacterium]